MVMEVLVGPDTTIAAEPWGDGVRVIVDNGTGKVVIFEGKIADLKWLLADAHQQLTDPDGGWGGSWLLP